MREPRRPVDERTPGSERGREDRIVHDVVDDPVNRGCLEQEHDVMRRDVDAMTLEPELTGFEGRSPADQLLSGLLRALLQPRDDHQTVHRAPFGAANSSLSETYTRSRPLTSSASALRE